MISVANFLSSDLDELAHELGAVLRSSLGESAGVEAAPDLADFRDGRIGVALICGLAYSLLHDQQPDQLLALAAPVVDDPRSDDAPVYFSEIVVPARSDARTLQDLSGRRFACNEEMSFSGYRALEHELRARGSTREFFGERVRTGSHGASLESILQGKADAAAIDSHVLLLARRRDPALAESLRVIESLGPYPAPPIAVNRSRCNLSARRMNELLARLPAPCLQRAAIRRWQPVDDASYDAIRAVTRDLPGLTRQ